jgi:hypothetical protein
MYMPFEIEPAEFSITGPGIACYKMRAGFAIDVISYSLDAPTYIPFGGIKSYKLDSGDFYGCTSVPRREGWL